jgi:hypothetical protein
MTIIIFYDHQLRDVVAPSRSLRLQAGRGGSPERFWLSNGSKAVFLDPSQASVFLNGLGKLHRCVQRGRLADRSFYSRDIYGVTGGVWASTWAFWRGDLTSALTKPACRRFGR